MCVVTVETSCISAHGPLLYTHNTSVTVCTSDKVYNILYYSAWADQKHRL